MKKIFIYLLMVLSLISIAKAQGFGHCTFGQYPFGNCTVNITINASNPIPTDGSGIASSAYNPPAPDLQPQGYTLTYICSKIKDFFQDDFNYTSADLTILQEDVRFEQDIIIPYTELENYIINYDIFCLGKNSSGNLVTGQATNQQSKKLNINSSAKIPFRVNIGKIAESEKPTLFSLINFFFPLDIIQSGNQANVTWQGKIRILPALAALSIIFVAFGIRYVYSKKKNINYSDPDEIGAKKA